MEIPLSTIYEIIMGTANITCKLTNLGKFKCYTKSGSKIVYEDDGLNKLQSFIIFPNKTTLSTGECEYTIGLTGQLEYQHPWVDWTYTVPSNAIKGTTYSYTMTGSAFGLSNYKGAIVFGVPSKTWSWDIETNKTTIHAFVSKSISSVGITITLKLTGDYSKLGSDTPVISVYLNRGTSLIEDIKFTVNKSNSTYNKFIEILEQIQATYSVRIHNINPSSGAEWEIISN